MISGCAACPSAVSSLLLALPLFSSSADVLLFLGVDLCTHQLKH
jgi:hypothetical protein